MSLYGIVRLNNAKRIEMKNISIIFILIASSMLIGCAADEPTTNIKAEHKAEAVNVAKKAPAPEPALIADAEEVAEPELIEIYVEEPEEAAPKKKKSSKKATSSSKSSSTSTAAAPKVVNTPPTPKVTTKAAPVVAPAPKPAPAKVAGKPNMKFDKEIHDFGRIKPGDIINYKFQFKNTGNAELVIENATATCGCTTPSFPFIPIGPGESGYIGVTFDSKGKIGKQKPAITLTTNMGKKKIYLEGYVFGELAKKQPGQ